MYKRIDPVISTEQITILEKLDLDLQTLTPRSKADTIFKLKFGVFESGFKNCFL